MKLLHVKVEQNKTKQNTETKKKRKGKWFCIYGLAKFRNSLRKEGRRKEPNREREREGCSLGEKDGFGDF